jgi:hypothetical protein
VYAVLSERELKGAILTKSDENSVDMIRVVVLYREYESLPIPGVNDSYKLLSQFQRTRAQVLIIPLDDLEIWRSRPDVLSVEPDYLVYPQQFTVDALNPQGETIPYAISLIQADDPRIPLADTTTDCFRICIVDSGVSLPHPDLVRICIEM